MVDTQLLDCLFEIDSQQQDWGDEGYQDNGEETCQGPTITTTETHAAGEISYESNGNHSNVSVCLIVLTPYTFFPFSLLCRSWII